MNIVVYKSKKILEVWENSKLVNTYPIAIGKSEVGHKQREGDMKTPEGSYQVCVKNPKSKFHLSLGLNYPNNNDAKSAFANNCISESEKDAICAAINEGQRPPWNTVLGGAIYIHGDLESKDWSEGCVRMYNSDIEEIYENAFIGMDVEIKP